MSGAEYRFFAWARMGIGALLGGAQRVVRLDLDGTGAVSKPVSTHGPDAITAIDPRAFVRSVPPPGAMDFEPNLFASLELAHPGMPWMVSKPADALGRVTPWIVLIVVEEQPGVVLQPTTKGLVLTIDPPASPAMELPDLAHAWAWAHAQTTAAATASIDPQVLARSGGDARARLIAPRRLAAGKTYLACVVSSSSNGAPAWSGNEASIRLPVYHAWRFGTGPGGDFAALVRLLTAEKLDASVGHRRVDAAAPGWGMPPQPGTSLDLTGALLSTEATVPAASAEVTALGVAIAAQIDAASAGQTPVYPPPFYGGMATRKETSATSPPWQSDLNRDVAQRIAAGLGAAVVRANVEALVTAAWAAAGDAERANRSIRHAELAAVVTQRLVAKHITPIADDGEVLAIARPLLARVRGVESRLTVAASVRASAMPDAALAPALRRLGRPAGPLARGKTRTRTGAMTRAIDAGRIVAVPPHVLASGAAGFDQVSAAARADTRFAAATDRAVDAARATWIRSIGSRPSPSLARARVPEIPDGETHTTPTPMSKVLDLDRAEVDEFAAAARRHQAYIVGKLEKVSDRPRLPLGEVHVAQLRAIVESQWTPARGIVPLLASRFEHADAAVLAGLGTFQPIRVTSVLEEPLVRGLQRLSPSYVMPGIEAVLDNRVAAAVTAPEFVRACLVGANEELARELLWRGLPTALGHTWLRTFWGRTALDARGVAVGVPDIPAIEGWPPNGPDPTPATLVLLVRGEVLRRYPNAVVYAVEARWEGNFRVVGETAPLAPVFTATLGADVALFGFDLAPDVARGHDAPPASPGWYFVIAEHPHEPRFGLAASAIAGDIAWSDVQPADMARSYLRADGPLMTTHAGTDAARMAALTLRHGVRVARHASTLMV